MGQTISTVAASPSGAGSAQNVLRRLLVPSVSLRTATRTATSSALVRTSTVIPLVTPLVAPPPGTTNIFRRRLLPPSLFSYPYPSSTSPSPSPHSHSLLPMASVHSAASSDLSTPCSSSSSSSVPTAPASPATISNSLSVSSRRLTAQNPMSRTDLSTIEQQIKMASLDQHRGYVQDSYNEVKQNRSTESLNENDAAGYQVIGQPFWNKGEFLRPSPSLLSTTLSSFPPLLLLINHHLVLLVLCFNILPSHTQPSPFSLLSPTSPPFHH